MGFGEEMMSEYENYVSEEAVRQGYLDILGLILLGCIFD